MLTSSQQEFSDSQNVTGAGATASTNYIDLGATGTVLGAPAALTRDVAKGTPVPIYVRFDSAPTGTSPTITVAVQVDDNTAFSSAKTVLTTDSKAGGAAGDEIYVPVYLPEGTDERYLRLNYTLGGTSPDYTLSAGVVTSKNSNKTVPGA